MSNEREIKFRGQRVDNGEWVYGSAMVWNGCAQIFVHHHMINNIWAVDTYRVKPETVGQFVGYDQLWQGDIVKAYRRDDAARKNPVVSEVTFLNGCFMLFNCTTHEFYRIWQSDYEIIGNKFQHPQLIQSK